jgi:hypothetical protein
MTEKSTRGDLGDQEVQLPYLLFKVKNLLEVAKQYFYTQESSSEALKKIDKALSAVDALPHQFDKN